MKLLRSFPLISFAIALLSIVSFCAATRQISFLLLTGAIAAVSWYVAEGPRSWALPKWAANILIIIASIAMVPDLIAHGNQMIEVMGRFAIWLMLVKLYEQKSHRDYAQMLWLSAILMIAGALVSKSLLLGLAVFVYSALGVYALLLYQLHTAHEIAREARQNEAPRHTRLTPPLRPVIGSAAGGQFISTAVSLGLMGIILSSAIFVLFPRGPGAGFIQQLTRRDQSKTGFVEQINLLTSSGTRITDSRTPVLRVRVTNSDGRGVEVPGGLYLRGSALYRFDPDEATWSPLSIPSVRIVQGTIMPPEANVLGTFDTNSEISSALANAYSVEIASLAALGNTAFSLLLPITVAAEHEQSYAFNQHTLGIALPAGGQVGTYTIQCDPLALEKTWREIVGRHHVRVPQSMRYSNRRVRTLTEDILRSAKLPADPPSGFAERGRYNRRVAQAVVEHFQSGYTYTLDLSDIRLSGDPIEQFIFEERRGHCEFYASAMAGMLQSIDVDARVITGFLGSEYLGDGEYLIRESHAHAWVEVRTGEYQWSTFDPTPPADLAEILNVEDSLAERARGLYEMLEVQWMSNIMNFEAGSQQKLEETLKLDSLQWIDDVMAGIGTSLGEVYDRFGWAGALQIIVVTAAVVVAVLIVIRLIRRSRRIRMTLQLGHLSGGEYRRLLRQLGFYIDMLDILRRGGVRKPLWQPPLAFADELALERPQIVEQVRTLSKLFYRARYGGMELTAEERERAGEHVATLASILRVHA